MPLDQVTFSDMWVIRLRWIWISVECDTYSRSYAVWEGNQKVLVNATLILKTSWHLQRTPVTGTNMALIFRRYAMGVLIIDCFRPGRPEEMAPVVSFLLSDDASYITGETIVAAGGFPSRL